MSKDILDTAQRIQMENEALASLYSNQGYRVLAEWMDREYHRAITEMMDERKREDNLRSIAREAKTYQRIMQRVSSAYKQVKSKQF